jgi:hypothetical protein
VKLMIARRFHYIDLREKLFLQDFLIETVLIYLVGGGSGLVEQVLQANSTVFIHVLFVSA